MFFLSGHSRSLENMDISFHFCQGRMYHKQHKTRWSCATNLPTRSKCLLFPRHWFWVSTSLIFRTWIEKQGWKAFSQLKNVTTRRTWRPGGFEVRSISSNFSTLQSVEDMTECNQMRSKQNCLFPSTMIGRQKIGQLSKDSADFPVFSVSQWFVGGKNFPLKKALESNMPHHQITIDANHHWLIHIFFLPRKCSIPSNALEDAWMFFSQSWDGPSGGRCHFYPFLKSTFA